MALKPINPTPEQRRIFFLDPEKPILISGRAGSGKTTTAVLRAKQMLSFYKRQGIENPKVGFFVFNKTLKHYLNQLAAVEFDPHEYNVMTLDNWCLDFLDQNGLRQETIATDTQREIILRKTIQDSKLSQRNPILAKLGEGFLMQEIDYLLGRFGLDTDKYIHSARDGRGDNPHITDEMKHTIANEIVPNYQITLQKSGLIDWNQFRDRTLSHMRSGTPYEQYPIIVVDEAQDLHALQIRITLELISPETNSITFIRDSTQRIYTANYVWNDVQLTFGLGSQLGLEKNYRNTRAIAKVAESLMQHETDQNDIDILDPSLTREEGEKPVWAQGKYTEQMQYVLERIRRIDPEQESIGILHMRGSDVGKLALYIRTHGFVCETFDEEYTISEATYGVFLSTLHSAKGLEFDHVFIVGYEDFFAPGRYGLPYRETSAHMTAHRKLLYTAITRSRKTLTITSSKDKYSRFLGEISPELLNTIHL